VTAHGTLASADASIPTTKSPKPSAATAALGGAVLVAAG
jgi:hypothetical protein